MKQKVSDLTYLGTEIIKNGESSLDEILKENYPVSCDDNDNSIEISDLELLYTPVQKKLKKTDSTLALGILGTQHLMKQDKIFGEQIKTNIKNFSIYIASCLLFRQPLHLSKGSSVWPT